MPIFSASSQEKLNTCNKDIITVMNEAIKYFDFTVIYGHRNKDQQFELFKQGRLQNANGEWVIYDKKKVVTYKDGYKSLSKHNIEVSEAIDTIPSPIDWLDEKRMCYFAGHIIAISKIFKAKGIIDRELKWGGDWDRDTQIKDETFVDLYHFELI